MFRTQSKLKELGKKIEQLRKKSSHVGSDMQDTFQDALTSASQKYEAAQEGLHKLREAGAEKWESVTTSLTDVLEDLEDAYHKAAAYLDQKREDYQTDYLESRLDTLDDKIAGLEARPKPVETTGLERFHEVMSQVHAKQEEARKKFQSLEATEDEGWNEVKEEMEAVLEELSTLYQKARDYLPEYRTRYQKNLEQTLTDFNEQITELRQKTDEASLETRAEFQEDLEELQQKRDAIQQRLMEFKRASGKVWEEFKSGTDDALQDLTRSYEKIRSNFDE